MRLGWARFAALDHVRSWRYRGWAIALVVVGIALAMTPLFNVLGFEFSFALALLGSVAAADLGAAFVRRMRDVESLPFEREGSGARIGCAALVTATATNLALLVPPLVIISLNGLRVRNCEWGFGVEAFLTMPCVSVMLASVIGVVVGLAAGRNRVLSNALPFVVLIGSLAWAVWRFYAAPPVFSYNAFVGYFPGNLYDEHVALRAPFWWSRLFQIVSATSLVAFAIAALDPAQLRLRLGALAGAGLRERWRAGALAVAVVTGLVATVLWSRSGELGFSVSAEDLERELAGRHATEHFVIRYPLGGEIQRDIELIAEDHEFRYAQLVRTLGAEVDGKITSYYFESSEQKFRLMGARRVYMAKPWRKEIYLHHQPFPHQVLKHEIAHVVAGEFGDPIFHVSAKRFLGLPVFFNVGLIEGIAVAADWPDHFTRELTPHQSVKAMTEMGYVPPVDKILSTGFLRFSSARSYTTAGSFVRHLLDTRGAAPLRTLYETGGDFEAAYDVPARELIDEWLAMIDAIELPPDAAESVRERFRHRSIFKRPCPHAIARQRDRAATALAEGRYDDAVHLMRLVCDESPDEPRYRMQLAQVLVAAGELDEAGAIFEGIAADSEGISSTVRAAALQELAAIAARAEDYQGAARILERAAELPVDDGTLRNLRARILAARHSGPAGDALRAYFWGDHPAFGIDPVLLVGRAAQMIAAEPKLGLGWYLLGFNLAGRGAAYEAADALDSALDRDLPGPLFEREAARRLAAAGYAAARWDLVERAAAILDREGQPEIERLYARDWLERLHWKRTGRLP